MSKIREALDVQLTISGYEKDAEKCIKIYNKLLEIFDGHVWSNEYNMLVTTHYIGKYPNATRIQKPTKIGEIFLNGIID